jgi:hypothetical protein
MDFNFFNQEWFLFQMHKGRLYRPGHIYPSTTLSRPMEVIYEPLRANYHLKEGTRNARIIPLYIQPAPRVIEDGAEVARFAVIPTGPNHHGDVRVKISFDIVFGEGSPLEGLGVKRTLADMGLCISHILSDFKTKFAGQMF